MRKLDMKKRNSRKEKIQNGEGESDDENKTDESKTQTEAVSSSSEAESDKEPPTKKKRSSKRKSSTSKKSKRESESSKLKDSKKEKEESDQEEKNSGDEEDKEDEVEKFAKSSKRKSSTSKKSKRESESSRQKDSKNYKEESDKEEKDNDDEDVEEQYEVEKIMDEKFVKGVRHYLIRWKGYEPESDSWEPESTLACAELIQNFKASQKEKGEESHSKKDKKSKSKKSNSKKPKDSAVVDWQSDDEFEVERILDVYFKKNGKREFLVSWKGYPTSQASWEPEDHLDCGDLITKYMNKVEKAKNVEQKELRVNRIPTNRYTLNMYSGSDGRKLSRRLEAKERVRYLDAE